ncbi:Hypothetical protein OINT_1002243 [Brucella intermedia LMG 3301]|uniref:Uncharacterized protein n=1 Tax=Brucella intermedia LMG 3301 TaxID=641118 RepID=C4WJ69_9HYPH|nr:Hypothetical protein OINT_1002243 [Brucella intermedia LMG 3301]
MPQPDRLRRLFHMNPDKFSGFRPTSAIFMSSSSGICFIS